MKALLAALALLILSPLGLAQSGTTHVTAHVLDPNSFAYANSPVHVTFFDPGTSGKLPLINGSTFQTNFTVFSTDSFGNFAIDLTDNALIASTSGATGTQWKFGICYSDGVTCFTYQATISGASVDLSAALQAAAAVIVRPGVGVTSVNCTFPLVGCPITGAGTIACPTCAFLDNSVDRNMLYNNGGIIFGSNLSYEPSTHTTYSHVALHSIKLDNSAITPTAHLTLGPGVVEDSSLVAGNCVQANGSQQLSDAGKPCSVTSIQLFGSSVMSVDSVIIGGVLTTLTSVNLTMPATGCPCRADVRWRTYYTTSNIMTISNSVSDGTNSFASGQTRNSVAAANTGGLEGSGFSPTTYANNANVTFTLKSQGNAGYTISAAAFQGPGENSGMQVAVVPSN